MHAGPPCEPLKAHLATEIPKRCWIQVKAPLLIATVKTTLRAMAQLVILPPYGTLLPRRGVGFRDLLGREIPPAGSEKLLGILLNTLNKDLKMQMRTR